MATVTATEGTITVAGQDMKNAGTGIAEEVTEVGITGRVGIGSWVFGIRNWWLVVSS
mgnify:CR=1 FL=1